VHHLGAHLLLDDEAGGLLERLNAGQSRMVLPVRHGVTVEEIREKSPSLANIVSVSSDGGIKTVVDKLTE
jgi:hypothetical protein